MARMGEGRGLLSAGDDGEDEDGDDAAVGGEGEGGAEGGAEAEAAWLGQLQQQEQQAGRRDFTGRFSEQVGALALVLSLLLL
jgi:hypothetical protein